MTCEEFQKLVHNTQETIDEDAYDSHYASCASCEMYLDNEITKAEEMFERVDDGKGGYFLSLNPPLS